MNTDKPTLVPIGTLSRLFGLSPTWIQKLARDGVILKDDRGKYELWTSITRYTKHLQERRTSSCGGDEKGDWNTERTRLTRAKADMAEMQSAILKGTVHEAKAVEAVWTDCLLACRAKLLAMPKKLAPRVQGVERLTAIETELEAAVTEALHELSNYDPALVTERYVSAHREELDTAAEVEV